MNLTVQIGNGTGSNPSITSIDLLASTISSGHVLAADIGISQGGDLQYQGPGRPRSRFQARRLAWHLC